VQDALAHPFFEPFHAVECPEHDCLFSFDFETSGANLTANVIRELIYKEAVGFEGQQLRQAEAKAAGPGGAHPMSKSMDELKQEKDRGYAKFTVALQVRICGQRGGGAASGQGFRGQRSGRARSVRGPLASEDS
jgi:hypothetical protein